MSSISKTYELKAAISNTHQLKSSIDVIHTVDILLPEPQLSTPANFSIDVIDNDISLLWDAVENATNYILQRAEQEDFSDAIQMYSGAAALFEDEDVEYNTLYYYRVKAQASGYTDSEWSDVMSEEAIPTLPDTTADGKQAFLVIGDSIAAGGYSGADQTLPAAGTAYEWVAGALHNFGGSLMSTPGPVNRRSPWAKFCIDYNTDSGKKAVIVNMAYSSTNCAAVSNNQDWSATGAHRAPAIAAANACMTALGLTKLKGIMICVGTNDISNLNSSSGNTDSIIDTAFTNLVNALQAAFGTDVPILFSQLGRPTAPGLKSIQVKHIIKAKCVSYANVHFGANHGAFTVGSCWAGDNIHPNVTGNNHAGAMHARWFKNNHITNKWARSIISCHFDEISEDYKTRINNFITTWQTAYLNWHFGYFTKTSLQLNAFQDWAFECNPLSLNNTTFVADEHVATNGSNAHFDFGYITDYSIIYEPTRINDIFTNVKIKTNNTPAGTLAYAYGQQGTQPRIDLLGQNASNQVIWSINVASTTPENYPTHTALQAGDYVVRRTASNGMALLFNGSSVDTSATASASNANLALHGGALNNNNTLQNRLNAEYHRFIRGRASSVSNWANFYADLNTLQGL